jgi:hypothetical protein
MSRIRQRPQPEREPDTPSPTQAQPAQISHYLARYRASTSVRDPAIWIRTQLWGCHVLWLWSSAGGEVWAWCLPFDSEVGGRLVFGSTQTYDDRTIIVPGFLRSRLAEHLAARTEPEESALVFTAAQGGPLRHSNFYKRVWRPAKQVEGVPEGLRIHDLRHTCAALLIAQGASPKAIQAHLGHSSIQVTFDRYGHLFPEDLEDLADRLDAARESTLADHTRTTRGPNADQTRTGGSGATA